MMTPFSLQLLSTFSISHHKEHKKRPFLKTTLMRFTKMQKS